MILTRTNEGGVGSQLLSAHESEALRTLMDGPAVQVAGQLAVVLFREGNWPTWSGARITAPQNEASLLGRKVVYGWVGGNQEAALVGGKLVTFGGSAEFAVPEEDGGDVRVTRLSLPGCVEYPPEAGREILAERLELDAARLNGGYPAIMPGALRAADKAARARPFEDPVLRAAVDMVLANCAGPKVPPLAASTL